MRLLLALFLLLPTQLWANCASAFRAGLTAYARADTALTDAETTLYRGLGWATRSRVLARLENRSPATTACTEIAQLQITLTDAQTQIARARSHFIYALTQCDAENQRRAQGNLDALSDTANDLQTQLDYLADLSTRCDTS